MNYKKILLCLSFSFIVLSMCVGCLSNTYDNSSAYDNDSINDSTQVSDTAAEESVDGGEDTETDKSQEDTFTLEDIPAYSGDLYIEVNDNKPFFTEDELTTEAFENYSELDSLGRCGVAYANICKELMPTEKRGNISNIHPSGWVQNKYPGIVDSQPPYLYNRCHLIGYKLAGENDNERNLITGTRYFNAEGMLPFEDEVWEWAVSNHVLYRVTPYFEGNNHVATGVLMEAECVENTEQEFCVFVYNVQPGIHIDYSDGSNHIDEDNGKGINDTADTDGKDSGEDNSNEASYVLNTNTRKFHLPTCKSVKEIREWNYMETTQTREEIINAGYSPCKRCNP